VGRNNSNPSTGLVVTEETRDLVRRARSQRTWVYVIVGIVGDTGCGEGGLCILLRTWNDLLGGFFCLLEKSKWEFKRIRTYDRRSILDKTMFHSLRNEKKSYSIRRTTQENLFTDLLLFIIVCLLWIDTTRAKEKTYECRCDERLKTIYLVYYESIKRKPKIRCIKLLLLER